MLWPKKLSYYKSGLCKTPYVKRVYIEWQIAGNILKCICLKVKCSISIQISLKIVKPPSGKGWYNVTPH